MHYTTHRFWERYNVLPEEVQRIADQCYELLKSDLRLNMRKQRTAAASDSATQTFDVFKQIGIFLVLTL